MKSQNALSWSGFFGATAVTVLALAAHALEGKLNPSQLNAIITAGQIQLFHAIALLAITSLSGKYNVFQQCGRLMVLGTAMFSFSIYLIMFKNVEGLEFLRFLWPITPVGGLVLISSWVLVLIQSRKIGKQ